MERTQTPTSSSIEAISHNATTAVLTIHFRRGTIYRYFMVPTNVHADFLAAPSKGAYFNAVIRPVYRSAKLYKEVDKM